VTEWATEMSERREVELSKDSASGEEYVESKTDPGSLTETKPKQTKSMLPETTEYKYHWPSIMTGWVTRAKKIIK